MADPYTGEIRVFGFNFAPRDWALCNGALLPLNQYTALYSLVGTAYGGNGTSNFQLPNLAARGFCESGQGPGLTDYSVGDAFGQQSVTLTGPEMAIHTHDLFAYEGGSGTPTAAPTASSALSAAGVMAVFANPPANQAMAAQAITVSGGGLAHENQQPGLPLILAICMNGVYPSFS